MKTKDLIRFVLAAITISIVQTFCVRVLKWEGLTYGEMLTLASFLTLVQAVREGQQ